MSTGALNPRQDRASSGPRSPSPVWPRSLRSLLWGSFCGRDSGPTVPGATTADPRHRRGHARLPTAIRIPGAPGRSTRTRADQASQVQPQCGSAGLTQPYSTDPSRATKGSDYRLWDRGCLTSDGYRAVYYGYLLLDSTRAVGKVRQRKGWVVGSGVRIGRSASPAWSPRRGPRRNPGRQRRARAAFRGDAELPHLWGACVVPPAGRRRQGSSRSSARSRSSPLAAPTAPATCCTHTSERKRRSALRHCRSRPWRLGSVPRPTTDTPNCWARQESLSLVSSSTAMVSPRWC